ncbi:MAG TPA: PstS family phosphate ABC transporter substrate-binding protein [Steroidobacteraceae bacterium]|nr:PstS family phosphate ABC transporter substrate-binding protein [Steroidobacteraceae bacterium]
MTRKTLAISLAATLVGALSITPAQAQSARDSINIVGSSTVYPFTTTVAEQFGRGGKFKTPKVESTGTGGGIKLFCNGIGPQYPDIANASRRIRPAELATCQKNGVKDVVEVKVGYDGIVMAENKTGTSLNLTRKDVYLALAKSVPDPANPSSLIPNPYTTWKDVNPKLPATKIEVLGPPPTSGTRDSFVELYLEAGCRTYAWLDALRSQDEPRFKRACDTVREDGAYVEAGENDNLIVQKLTANKDAVGIFGYSFLEENLDKLKGAVVDGVSPTFETVASGKYPASRPLFIYVKKQHVKVIPGIEEFIAEYVSEKALGEEGYLADKGLIPPTKSEIGKIRDDAKALKPLKL